MTKARTWMLGVGALIVVIIVAGYALGISPLIDQVSAASAQTVSQKTTNQQTSTKLANLQIQFNGISKLKKTLSKLRLSIPEQLNAAAFMNELTALSGSTGVVIQTVTLGNAIIYVAPGAPAAAAAAPASTTATATPTASPAATPTAPVAAATTTNGLVSLPITVGVKGSFESVRLFVGALQSGQRLYFATSTTLQTDITSGTVTGTIVGNIYTLTGSSDAKGTTAPSTSYPTSTPTLTPTSTPSPTATTTTSGAKTGSSTGNTSPSAPPTPSDTPSPAPSS